MLSTPPLSILSLPPPLLFEVSISWGVLADVCGLAIIILSLVVIFRRPTFSCTPHPLQLECASDVGALFFFCSFSNRSHAEEAHRWGERLRSLESEVATR